MRAMGLDLSTKTGLAIVTPGKEPVEYTQQIHFDKLTGWDRASAIAGAIMKAHAKFKPDVVIIEGYGYGNAHTLATLVEIGTIIKYFFWQEDIPYLDVPPTSVKQFVTGKGNSKKEQMILEVYKNWGFEAPTNDIADGVGLGMFGLAAIFRNVSKDRLAVIDKVLKGQPEFVKHLAKIKAQCN